MLALTLGLLAIFLSSTPAFAQNFPEANGQWVIDDADILTPADEIALNSKLEQFEKTNGHQLIVLTVKSLDGRDVADYGYQAGRHYKVGDAAKDDGVVLLIAPNERKLHIAVGYGLEPILTDAYSSVIINQAITPQFKAGNFPGGINAGVDEIIKQISLPPEQARARAEQVKQSVDDTGDAGAAVFWLFIFLFVILPIIIRMMRGNRGRRFGGSGPVVIWGPGFGSGYGGGGFGGGFGGGGFGGGGGGGFSGGGGSFGGGGASGGW